MNAGGLRCCKYGVTRESVLALDVVLADGTLMSVGHRTIKGVTGLDMVGLFVGATAVVSWMRRSGRRRREEYVRCGGDPTGVSDLVFGVMRGRRSPEGTWEVPVQGSGDYV